jgi:hypothetical protein
MKKRILTVVTIFSVFLLWGCYPQGPDYVEELDVVVTYHNDTYDFTAKQTYAMPDQIVKITGNIPEGEEPEFIPDETAQEILTMIEDNMEALGWQRVEISEDPDLLLGPAAWETTTVVYWYDWWYWWYGGYYPGWGWTGGYYPPVYYESFTTGTLLMTLVDKDVVGANGNPIVQWTGAVNGILTGYYDEARMSTAIDKAFDQSPYLKTN